MELTEALVPRDGVVHPCPQGLHIDLAARDVNATGTSPRDASGLATTAASAIAGCSTSDADSSTMI
jgi:hypothetical protein